MNEPTEDVDNQNDAWWDVQVETARQELNARAQLHRCPPDMPPCPECEAREEKENEREFGAQ